MGKANITYLKQGKFTGQYITITDDLIEYDLYLEEVIIPETYLNRLDENIFYVDITIRYIHNNFFKYPKRKRIINKLLNE